MNESELAQALKELPDIKPPNSVWTSVRARVPAPRSIFPTIAAAVVLAVTLSLLVAVDRRMESVDGAVEAVAGSVRGTFGGTNGQVEALVMRSQQLEEILRRTPRFSDDSPTMRVLRSRIAAVDADISQVRQPVDAEALWRQRVSLMESYRELRHDRNVSAVRRVVY